MKSLQDQVKAGLKKFKTDGEIIDAIIKSKNRENLPGRGRRLAGTGSSRRVVHEESFGTNIITRDEIQHLMNREHREKEILKKQAEDAQLEARLATQQFTGLQSFLSQFMTHFNSQAQNVPGFVPFTTPLPTYASGSTSQNPVHANASTSTSVPPPYHNSAPLIPDSGIAPIPPLSPPDIYRCFRQMNPGCSRVPTDVDYPNENEVTDQEGDDEDGNQNNEDGVTDQEDDDGDGNQNNESDDE